MLQWVLTITGINAPGSPWYNFWSGFAGDVFLFGGAITLYRKLNCHVDNCKRLGLHHVAGTPYIVCKKHHPTTGNSLESIHKAHKEAK